MNRKSQQRNTGSHKVAPRHDEGTKKQPQHATPQSRSKPTLYINLYVDIDGVLHPFDHQMNAYIEREEVPPGAFRNQQFLLDAIRDLPVRIVISSNWRTQGKVLDKAIAAQQLDPAIVSRFHPNPGTSIFPTRDERYMEIANHDPDAFIEGRFVIVDDNDSYFPSRAINFHYRQPNEVISEEGTTVICDSSTGLTDITATALRKLIQKRVAAAAEFL